MALVKRGAIFSIAYCIAVMASALLTTAGFWGVFRVADWDFLIFATVGIFILSLPLSLLALVFRGTSASSLSAAIVVGCVNGLISSILFVMIAAFLSPLIMLPAGGGWTGIANGW